MSDIDGKTERSICAGAHESISKQATEISQHDPSKREARVERGGSQQNFADSLLAPSCLSYLANHFRSRTLHLYSLGSQRRLKRVEGRYPAGIRVNRVIVLDERH